MISQITPLKPVGQTQVGFPAESCSHFICYTIDYIYILILCFQYIFYNFSVHHFDILASYIHHSCKILQKIQEHSNILALQPARSNSGYHFLVLEVFET